MGSKRGIGRRGFIGGSDARIIMGDDEVALARLWREKRGLVIAHDDPRVRAAYERAAIHVLSCIVCHLTFLIKSM